MEKILIRVGILGFIFWSDLNSSSFKYSLLYVFLIIKFLYRKLEISKAYPLSFSQNSKKRNIEARFLPEISYLLEKFSESQFLFSHRKNLMIEAFFEIESSWNLFEAFLLGRNQKKYLPKDFYFCLTGKNKK